MTLHPVLLPFLCNSLLLCLLLYASQVDVECSMSLASCLIEASAIAMVLTHCICELHEYEPWLAVFVQKQCICIHAHSASLRCMRYALHDAIPNAHTGQLAQSLLRRTLCLPAL